MSLTSAVIELAVTAALPHIDVLTTAWKVSLLFVRWASIAMISDSFDGTESTFLSGFLESSPVSALSSNETLDH